MGREWVVGWLRSLLFHLLHNFSGGRGEFNRKNEKKRNVESNEESHFCCLLENLLTEEALDSRRRWRDTQREREWEATKEQSGKRFVVRRERGFAKAIYSFIFIEIATKLWNKNLLTYYGLKVREVGGSHSDNKKGEKNKVLREGGSRLLLEELLREARVVVGILHGLSTLRVVGRHGLGTVVGLFLGQVLQERTRRTI